MVLRETDSSLRDLEMPLPGRGFRLGKGSQVCGRAIEALVQRTAKCFEGQPRLPEERRGVLGDLGLSTVSFSETEGEFVDVTFS